MPGYVALLRGVNVGGANKVPMAQLRALVESLGYGDVSTYIQSGNVIFTASGLVNPEQIEDAITGRFGLDIAVTLRTSSQLRRVLDANPFPDLERSKLHVGFLASGAPASTVRRLDGGPFDPERFVVRGTEVYLHLPDGMGRAKSPAYLGRNLRISTTFRNWNTVVKLCELSN